MRKVKDFLSKFNNRKNKSNPKKTDKSSTPAPSFKSVNKFSEILNERPEDMPFDDYKEALRMQTKRIRSYVKRGAFRPIQYHQ